MKVGSVMNTITDLFHSLRSNEVLLSNLAQSLRFSPGVISVHTGLDLRNYRSGTVVEAYVEAEMGNGCAVTWWLDIRERKHEWEFEASILGTDAQGQFTLRRLPTSLVLNIESAPKAFFDKLMEARQIEYCIEKWERLYTQRHGKCGPTIPQVVFGTTVVVANEINVKLSNRYNAMLTEIRNAVPGLQIQASPDQQDQDVCYVLT